MIRQGYRTTPPKLRVLNWGLGQDSTTIALLAAHGSIPPFDAIIWADTQQEPAEVYATLAWVLPLLKTPVYRVTAGDLGADILRIATATRVGAPHRTASSPNAPFFVRNAPNLDYPTADSGGTLWRRCTVQYKIAPIRRKIRELLGVGRRGPIPAHSWIEQAIGFPLDEVGRTFCSDVHWIVNTFPLIDLRMRKRDCARWLTEHGYPIPPKSSCRFCPYHSDAYWRRMRDTQPEEWARTVAFEQTLQAGKIPGVRGTPYLHKSMVPLPCAPIDVPDADQEELFCFACNT